MCICFILQYLTYINTLVCGKLIYLISCTNLFESTANTIMMCSLVLVWSTYLPCRWEWDGAAYTYLRSAFGGGDGMGREWRSPILRPLYLSPPSSLGPLSPLLVSIPFDTFPLDFPTLLLFSHFQRQLFSLYFFFTLIRSYSLALHFVFYLFSF